MIFSIDKETIDFLCKNKLTFTQYFICLLIHKQDTTTIIRLQKEVDIIGDCLIAQGNGKYKSEFTDLVDRGFIVRIRTAPKGEPNLLDDFALTNKFREDWVDFLTLAPQEFFDAYPQHVLVNGVNFPAKGCDFDEMSQKYLKAINNSVRKHKEVITKLKSLGEYAPINIMKFIGGRMWETVEVSKAKSRGY